MRSHASFAPSLLLVAAALAGCNDAKPPAPPAMQAPQVGVITLEARAVSVTAELAGRVVPSLIAEVRPQVSGIIEKRHFTEGTEVKEGEILYSIADAPYKSALDNAAAVLDRAQGAVTAAVNKAERYRSLSNRQVASLQDMEAARAAADQARADVAAAEANVAAAKINLDRTKVRAPIGGRIGTSALTVGALVTANQSNALATIQTLDPIYVDVPQSSTMVQRVRSDIAEGKLVPGAEGVRITLLLDERTEYKHHGVLKFTDVTVSEGTSTVTLRATFANPDRYLLPGMFVRGVVTLGTQQNAVLAPQRAVSRNPRGQATAMVAGEGDKAEARVLDVGRVIGGDWIVESGLKPGDRLIVDGLQRVRPGAPVRPVPFAPAPPPAAAKP